MDSFASLGLAEPLSAALESFGFEGPTPIQALAIPLLLAHRDAFIEAETGTGKTFAYLAPAFQSILGGAVAARGSGEAGILVAAPTQELAVQIGREAGKLAEAAGISLKTAVLLGGTPLDKLAARLRERPDLVIGTLGRLGDLIQLGKLKLSRLQFLVLDEADRLFAPETAQQALALLKATPESCARVLVSATLPEKLRRELRPLLRDAAEPKAEGDAVLSGSIEHWCFYCDGRKRLDFVRRLEAALKPERCLVFLSAASRVEEAARKLAADGLPIAAIHAGMEKEERRVALERFAEGELRYLLTSDLGARGLDIAAVSHVVSLDLPEEPTIYTHRAGRTGRAGAEGISIVLADGVELARASKIAVRGKFVFRCKFLEGGAVYEPTPAEFFARAYAAEDERLAARAAREGGEERRRPQRPVGTVAYGRGGRPSGEVPGRDVSRPTRPRQDEAVKGEGFYLRKKPAAPLPPRTPAQPADGERARGGEEPGRRPYPPRDGQNRERPEEGRYRQGWRHDGGRHEGRPYHGGPRDEHGDRGAPRAPRADRRGGEEGRREPRGRDDRRRDEHGERGAPRAPREDRRRDENYRGRGDYPRRDERPRPPRGKPGAPRPAPRGPHGSPHRGKRPEGDGRSS